MKSPLPQAAKFVRHFVTFEKKLFRGRIFLQAVVANFGMFPLAFIQFIYQTIFRLPRRKDEKMFVEKICFAVHYAQILVEKSNNGRDLFSNNGIFRILLALP